VAGRYRGRRIKSPPGARTRPTAHRVREAVFSILGPIEGARVADLFAGTGALGIEALSRGAASATFVERDRGTAGVIDFNLASVDATDAGTVVVQDAIAWLAASAGGQAFDLVFVDPPYSSADRLGGPLTEHLPGVLAPKATIVAESDKRAPLALDLPLADARTYGDTQIAIHRVD
jgi:16S rRNA (guanine(966)-N(2))-methyltransferase RsmD